VGHGDGRKNNPVWTKLRKTKVRFVQKGKRQGPHLKKKKKISGWKKLRNNPNKKHV